MQRDAELHADEDKRKRELAEIRNTADTATWSVEKSIKEHGDKIPERDKAALQAAIDRVKQAAKGDDPEAVKQAIGDLEQAASAMAQYMQGQPGGAGGAEPGGSDTKGKDDVIDAEFEDKT
jgi:molecular chaperone DnaK